MAQLKVCDSDGTCNPLQKAAPKKVEPPKAKAPAPKKEEDKSDIIKFIEKNWILVAGISVGVLLLIFIMLR